MTRKNCQKKKIHVCVKCGSEDILIRNCGYSSFNSGSGKCQKCGNEAIASNGSWDNDDWIVRNWNHRNPTKEEEISNLSLRIDTLKKKIKEVLERKW